MRPFLRLCCPYPAAVVLAVLVCFCVAQPAWSLPRPIGKDVLHEVSEGETLFTISRKYSLAPDHIMWANGVSHKNPPRVGDKLIIPLRRIPPAARDASTSIVLNLPERILYLYKGGAVVKWWGVAIGEDLSPTPTGTFSIIAKEVNPTWEPPLWMKKKPVPPGPDNPLGDRWMQITPNMVGIHGTNDPDSIGGVASLGCVRLYPEAVRELYDHVRVGTRVSIIYEQVRIGKEPDDTLVWTFFPDPYHKWFTTFHTQEALSAARHEGHDISLTDFEIEEAMTQPLGLINPVFGRPLALTVNDEPLAKSAYVKATGHWLDSGVLEAHGFSTVFDSATKTTKITGKDGKVLIIKPEPTPLNPRRVPKTQSHEPLRLEGHQWKGKTWLPVPLTLDYFQIPYQWDSKLATLNLQFPLAPSDSVEP